MYANPTQHATEMRLNNGVFNIGLMEKIHGYCLVKVLPIKTIVYRETLLVYCLLVLEKCLY